VATAVFDLMPPRLSWRSVLPGIVAIAVVLSIALGIIFFAGIGQLRGETIRLYVLVDQARGVLHGTEVWLAGQKIGVVNSVQFRPPTSDTGARVVIVTTVRKQDAQALRHDSHAEVRAGLNFIGPMVVYLTAGTPNSPPVRDGDTLHAGAQSDVEVAMTKLNAATVELPPIMADVRTIMARVRDSHGTIGAMWSERGGKTFAELRARYADFHEHMFDGGEALVSMPGVRSRAERALARVDSIRTLLASPRSSVGRFRRDSTLADAVATVRDEIGEVRAMMADSSGTLGRLKIDSALARSIAEAQREMTRLSDDIRRRPLRYVHF
jgi:hypothetical protein